MSLRRRVEIRWISERIETGRATWYWPTSKVCISMLKDMIEPEGLQSKRVTVPRCIRMPRVKGSIPVSMHESDKVGEVVISFKNEAQICVCLSTFVDRCMAVRCRNIVYDIDGIVPTVAVSLSLHVKFRKSITLVVLG